MIRQKLQKTSSSFWEVWGKQVLIGLAVIVLIVALILWLILRQSTVKTENYTENMEFVTQTVLEKSGTLNVDALKDINELAGYTTDEYYTQQVLQWITLASPEYSFGYGVESLEDLPEDIRDFSALKKWLKQTGYASSLVVLSVTPTKYTDPNHGEATATGVYAVYGESGILSQAVQTYEVYLAHENTSTGSYWVVDKAEVVPTPTADTTNSGS